MSKVILSDILDSYSEGELAAIVGEANVKSYEKLTGLQVDKTALVHAVNTQFGFELLIQSDSRNKLIERMDPDHVRFLTDELIDSDVEVSALGTHEPYEFLSALADRWPDKFAAKMGFSDSFNRVSEASESIQGIVPVPCWYPLYPYQRDIVHKVNTLFDTDNEHRCLIHLPTGAGKTRTAMNIATEHLRKNEGGLVLWLADTSELCTQAVDEFSKAWSSLGNRDTKIYSYYGDTNISLGGIETGFLVAGLQKLNSVRGKDEIGILYRQLQQHVSLIIFDEAHKAIARTYKQVINDMLFHAEGKYFVGLTATPGRKLEIDVKGEDEELTRLFHGNKVTMAVPGYHSPIKYLVEKQYLAETEFINIDYAAKKLVLADEFENQKRTNEILKILSDDDNRNYRLLDVIKDEYQAGSSIIVFACSVDHSRLLASLLSFNGVEAYSLDSHNDDRVTRRFKVSQYMSGNVRVLVNFNILTAGFDAPITNTVIIARPTDSLVQYSQMAGRAMRGLKSKGNETCKVYTVRDDIPVFTSVVRAFSHWDNLWTEV